MDTFIDIILSIFAILGIAYAAYEVKENAEK